MACLLSFLDVNLEYLSDDDFRTDASCTHTLGQNGLLERVFMSIRVLMLVFAILSFTRIAATGSLSMTLINMAAI
jgi:hypothetical protein